MKLSRLNGTEVSKVGVLMYMMYWSMSEPLAWIPLRSSCTVSTPKQCQVHTFGSGVCGARVRLCMCARVCVDACYTCVDVPVCVCVGAVTRASMCLCARARAHARAAPKTDQHTTTPHGPSTHTRPLPGQARGPLQPELNPCGGTGCRARADARL